MALTLTVAGLKGGIGKTSLSINIAGVLRHAGHRVLICDCDPQASARTWAAQASKKGIEGAPVIAMEGESLRRDLESVAAAFDVCIIDSPPRLETETRSAMLASDIVVIPASPGAFDYWALSKTLEVLRDARSIRPELRAVVVPNRVDRTSLARSTMKAVEDLGARVLDHSIGSRVAVGEATLRGQTVIDYSPKSKAAKEIELVTKEILEIVRGEA